MGLPDDWKDQALSLPEQIAWHDLITANTRPGRARYTLTDILRTNNPLLADRRGSDDEHIERLCEFLWR